jgi:predicted lipoprotein with Yx(FWY)xxD motif
MGMQGMGMSDMPAKKAADGTLTNASGMTLYTFDKDAAARVPATVRARRTGRR